MPKKKVQISREKIAFLKAMPLVLVLEGLHLYVKKDRDFHPTGNLKTIRVIASEPSGFQHELVITDSLWFDTRKQVGKKGAIDLVMHLTGCTFKEAINRLTEIHVSAAERNNA